MKIPYNAFKALNELLRLQTGLTFNVSRQTCYNYRLGGVPPERFAALLFCVLSHNIPGDVVYKTLENAQCHDAVEHTLNQLLHIAF